MKVERESYTLKVIRKISVRCSYIIYLSTNDLKCKYKCKRNASSIAFEVQAVLFETINPFVSKFYLRKGERDSVVFVFETNWLSLRFVSQAYEIQPAVGLFVIHANVCESVKSEFYEFRSRPPTRSNAFRGSTDRDGRNHLAIA